MDPSRPAVEGTDASQVARVQAQDVGSVARGNICTDADLSKVRALGRRLSCPHPEPDSFGLEESEEGN